MTAESHNNHFNYNNQVIHEMPIALASKNPRLIILVKAGLNVRTLYFRSIGLQYYATDKIPIPLWSGFGATRSTFESSVVFERVHTMIDGRALTANHS